MSNWSSKTSSSASQFDNPPNDPDYDRQWALPHIQAEPLGIRWASSSDITVAVIDTGVCMSHEDLVGPRAG